MSEDAAIAAWLSKSIREINTMIQSAQVGDRAPAALAARLRYDRGMPGEPEHFDPNGRGLPFGRRGLLGVVFSVYDERPEKDRKKYARKHGAAEWTYFTRSVPEQTCLDDIAVLADDWVRGLVLQPFEVAEIRVLPFPWRATVARNAVQPSLFEPR